MVTGDYSRGAGGMWIENGELPIRSRRSPSRANLQDMFGAIEMIGNDLVWRSSTVSPTLKIAEMTIAGA